MPGQHAFPFSFVLPPSLPSSFEGGIGYVRYTIKGTIDRPWRFDDHTVLAYTVLSPLDLNQLPQSIVRHISFVELLELHFLFISCFTSSLRNFHLYGDVTITGEELQNLGLCSALWTFKHRGIFIAQRGLL
jgi:hypothetical protein